MVEMRGWVKTPTPLHTGSVLYQTCLCADIPSNDVQVAIKNKQQTCIFNDERRDVVQTSGRLEPDDDTARLRLEQKCVTCWSTVGMSRATDDQWFHWTITVIQDTAYLVTGAWMTAVNDALYLGVGLGRRRRPSAVSTESCKGQLDSLSGLGCDLPPTIRLRDQSYLTTDVSSANSHCRVPSLPTFWCPVVMPRTRYNNNPTKLSMLYWNIIYSIEAITCGFRGRLLVRQWADFKTYLLACTNAYTCSSVSAVSFILRSADLGEFGCTKDHIYGLWSLKLLTRRPVIMEQSAVENEEVVGQFSSRLTLKMQPS